MGALARAGGRLDAELRHLRALSPARTLERGYAVVTGPDGTVVRDASLRVRGYGGREWPCRLAAAADVGAGTVTDVAAGDGDGRWLTTPEPSKSS